MLSATSTKTTMYETEIKRTVQLLKHMKYFAEY